MKEMEGGHMPIQAVDFGPVCVHLVGFCQDVCDMHIYKYRCVHPTCKLPHSLPTVPMLPPMHRRGPFPPPPPDDGRLLRPLCHAPDRGRAGSLPGGRGAPRRARRRPLPCRPLAPTQRLRAVLTCGAEVLGVRAGVSAFSRMMGLLEPLGWWGCIVLMFFLGNRNPVPFLFPKIDDLPKIQMTIAGW